MIVLAALMMTSSGNAAAEPDCMQREAPEEAVICANEFYAGSVEVLSAQYDPVRAYMESRDASGLPKDFVSDTTGLEDFDEGHVAWITYRNETCYFEGRLEDRTFFIPAAVILCRARMNLERAEMLQAYLPAATPIVIGEQYELEALGDQRKLNIILPAGYNDEPVRLWPVVYMLDGGMQQDLMLVTGIERWNRLWGRSAQAIIVGIETKDRQRELLPPTADPAEQEQYPTAGESEAFRAWIASTVKPMIEGKYRTNGTDILAGESAAGHFVVETWVTSSDLFDGYAAISPSMQWSNQFLARQIKGSFEGKPRIFLSIADEGGATEEGIMDLADAMNETQDFCFSDRRSDLVHANSLHGLLPEALQYLLPTNADWLAEYGLKLRCERLGQSGNQ